MASNASTGAVSARPMASRAACFGRALTNGGGGDFLVVLAGPEENLADLEQGDIAVAAIGVALRRGDQPRQQARPHVGKVR